MAAVEIDGKWGYIDTLGEIRVRPQYDRANYYGFKDGRAIVQRNGKWGVIDTNGNVKVDFAFDDVAWQYSEGLLGVAVSDKMGYIDRDGEFIWAPTK